MRQVRNDYYFVVGTDLSHEAPVRCRRLHTAHPPDMGAALDTIEINHPASKHPQQVRLSRNIRRVIDLMVHQAVKLNDALETVGITRNAYYVASRKPEFTAYQQEAMRVLRSHAVARSLARIDTLADESESDHVKYQSNVFLLGTEGIGPIQRIENTHIHRNQQPGLTINFMVGEQPRLIDSQVRQCEDAKVISGLPQSVPHPSMRNALPAPMVEADPPGKPHGRAAGRRGAK